MTRGSTVDGGLLSSRGCLYAACCNHNAECDSSFLTQHIIRESCSVTCDDGACGSCGRRSSTDLAEVALVNINFIVCTKTLASA